jgi:hypothetical protein
MFFELFKGQKILKGINECVCIWIEEKQSWNTDERALEYSKEKFTNTQIWTQLHKNSFKKAEKNVIKWTYLHVCNTSTWEVKAGRSQVLGQSDLHTKTMCQNKWTSCWLYIIMTFFLLFFCLPNYLPGIHNSSIKKLYFRQGLVAHACDSNYLGGRNQEDHSLRTAWGGAGR